MNGRKAPSLLGACGAVMARNAVLHADSSAPRAQLMGPRTCGLVPVKSTSIASPLTVTTTRIGIASSVIPSPSMTSSAS